jgi:hypothetical protein
MLLLLPLLACTGTEKDSAADIAAPSIAWLAPAAGGTVTAGEVACSTVVDDFTLHDPAKHNTGAPVGYIGVSVDGTEALTSGTTTFGLTLAAGAHELTAQLYYADGDEVIATDTLLCDEDSTDAACVPVVATIDVTAE